MKRAAKSKKNVCLECPAPCCRDLAMEIVRPRTRDQIESLKWALQYDTVSVYLRNRRWYILIRGNCMYLTEDNMCRNYERRPEICRKHNPPLCERFGEFWEVMIETPIELEKYLNGRKSQGTRRRGRRK